MTLETAEIPNFAAKVRSGSGGVHWPKEARGSTEDPAEI